MTRQSTRGQHRSTRDGTGVKRSDYPSQSLDLDSRPKQPRLRTPPGSTATNPPESPANPPANPPATRGSRLRQFLRLKTSVAPNSMANSTHRSAADGAREGLKSSDAFAPSPRTPLQTPPASPPGATAAATADQEAPPSISEVYAALSARCRVPLKNTGTLSGSPPSGKKRSPVAPATRGAAAAAPAAVPPQASPAKAARAAAAAAAADTGAGAAAAVAAAATAAARRERIAMQRRCAANHTNQTNPANHNSPSAATPKASTQDTSMELMHCVNAPEQLDYCMEYDYAYECTHLEPAVEACTRASVSKHQTRQHQPQRQNIYAHPAPVSSPTPMQSLPSRTPPGHLNVKSPPATSRTTDNRYYAPKQQSMQGSNSPNSPTTHPKNKSASASASAPLQVCNSKKLPSKLPSYSNFRTDYVKMDSLVNAMHACSTCSVKELLPSTTHASRSCTCTVCAGHAPANAAPACNESKSGKNDIERADASSIVNKVSPDANLAQRSPLQASPFEVQPPNFMRPESQRLHPHAAAIADPVLRAVIRARASPEPPKPIDGAMIGAQKLHNTLTHTQTQTPPPGKPASAPNAAPQAVPLHKDSLMFQCATPRRPQVPHAGTQCRSLRRCASAPAIPFLTAGYSLSRTARGPQPRKRMHEVHVPQRPAPPGPEGRAAPPHAPIVATAGTAHNAVKMGSTPPCPPSCPPPDYHHQQPIHSTATPNPPADGALDTQPQQQNCTALKPNLQQNNNEALSAVAAPTPPSKRRIEATTLEQQTEAHVKAIYAAQAYAHACIEAETMAETSKISSNGMSVLRNSLVGPPLAPLTPSGLPKGHSNANKYPRTWMHASCCAHMHAAHAPEPQGSQELPESSPASGPEKCNSEISESAQNSDSALNHDGHLQPHLRLKPLAALVDTSQRRRRFQKHRAIVQYRAANHPLRSSRASCPKTLLHADSNGACMHNDSRHHACTNAPLATGTSGSLAHATQGSTPLVTCI